MGIMKAVLWEVTVYHSIALEWQLLKNDGIAELYTGDVRGRARDA